MNVLWMLPDQPARKQEVADVEQLMFLLRLTGRVSRDGKSYRVVQTELLIDEEPVVKVLLDNPENETAGDWSPADPGYSDG